MSESADEMETTHDSPDDGQLTIRIPNPKMFMARQSLWIGRRGKPRCDHCRLNNLKCDRVLPACNHCAWAVGRECRYTPLPTPAHRGIPRCDRCRSNNLKCDRNLPICNHCTEESGAQCNYTPKKRQKTTAVNDTPSRLEEAENLDQPGPSDLSNQMSSPHDITSARSTIYGSDGVSLISHPHSRSPSPSLMGSTALKTRTSRGKTMTGRFTADYVYPGVAPQSIQADADLPHSSPGSANPSHRDVEESSEESSYTPPPREYPRLPRKIRPPAPTPHRRLEFNRNNKRIGPVASYSYPVPHIPPMVQVKRLSPERHAGDFDGESSSSDSSLPPHLSRPGNKPVSGPIQMTANNNRKISPDDRPQPSPQDVAPTQRRIIGYKPVAVLTRSKHPAKPAIQHVPIYADVPDPHHSHPQVVIARVEPWFDPAFATLPPHVLTHLRGINAADVPNRAAFNDSLSALIEGIMPELRETACLTPAVYAAVARSLSQGYTAGLPERLRDWVNIHHMSSGSDRVNLIIVPMDLIYRIDDMTREQYSNEYRARVDGTPLPPTPSGARVHVDREGRYCTQRELEAGSFERIAVQPQIYDILTFAHQGHHTAIGMIHHVRKLGYAFVTWPMVEMYVRLCPTCNIKEEEPPIASGSRLPGPSEMLMRPS